MFIMYYILVHRDNLKKRKNLKKLDKVEREFKRAETEYSVIKTEGKRHLREVTKEITSGSGNTVVVMGGDGSLHDVLNAFENFEGNALGLIPFGTGNDFAKSAKIPKNVEKAARLIIGAPPKRIDFIEFESGLRSINSVGMGIDVDVLKRAYSGKNNKKSKYLHSLIISLARFESYNFTVKYAGREEEHYGLIAAFGNGSYFGGGINMFPEASIADGVLNLVIVDYISKFATIGAFIKLMLGKVNKVKQVTAVAAEQVEFVPHCENYTIQADGELYENHPFKAGIVKDKLSFHTAI